MLNMILIYFLHFISAILTLETSQIDVDKLKSIYEMVRT